MTTSTKAADQPPTDEPPAPLVKLADYGTLAAGMALLADDAVPIIDKAPVFAILHRVQLEINRALRPVKAELTRALATMEVNRVGNLRIRWKPQSVEFPVNEPGNWTDATVQEALAGLAADPQTAAYVHRIPDHYEIDPKAIAGGMHDGDAAARQLWRQMNQHGWRVEVHPRAELEIDEVRLA